eukprot:gene10329-12681_t
MDYSLLLLDDVDDVDEDFEMYNYDYEYGDIPLHNKFLLEKRYIPSFHIQYQSVVSDLKKGWTDISLSIIPIFNLLRTGGISILSNDRDSPGYCVKSEIEFMFSFIDKDGETALTVLPTIPHLKLGDIYLFFKNLPNYAVNYKNAHDCTPLHLSVLNQNELFSQQLLERGVNVEALDHRNLTALDIAIHLKNENLIELLKKYKTPQNDVNTPIFLFGQYLLPNFTIANNPIPEKVLFNQMDSSPSQIEFGKNFSIILTDTGSVYSFGTSSYGKLGHTTKLDVPIPTQILTLKSKNIKSIACGDEHTLALDEFGQLYVWGNEQRGRLGLGNGIKAFVPTLLKFPQDEVITKISCGSDFSMALTSEGDVYSWGNGFYGKLGYKCELSQSTPKQIQFIPKIKDIACGNWHSLILSQNGSVYSFGSNAEGRLGRQLPKNMKDDFTPIVVSIDQKIKQIWCGSNFSIGLSENNLVWGWGDNSSNQLGTFSIPPKGMSNTSTPTIIKSLLPFSINSIQVGSHHIAVLTNNGEVITIGHHSATACGASDIGRMEAMSMSPGNDFIRIVKTPENSTVYKISAGSNCTMISLSIEHQSFGFEMSKLISSMWTNKTGIISNSSDESPFSDLKLVISESSECIYAHRAIVACRCHALDQLFRKEIKSPNTGNFIQSPTNADIRIDIETQDSMILLKFSPHFKLDSLKQFIKFIYTDHIYLKEINNDGGIKLLSNILSIERLIYLCNETNISSIPNSSLIDDFSKLSNPDFIEHYSDIAFKIKSENQTIRSYKVLLNHRSKYFSMMLMGNFKEKDEKEIELYDVTGDNLKFLLNYIHNNSVPTDPNDLIELVILSDLHQMSRLKDLCSTLIRPFINESNLLYIYNLSLEYSISILKSCCEYKFKMVFEIDLPTLPFYDQLSKNVIQNIQALCKK